MDLSGCPVCSTPFGPDWWLLARHTMGGDPIATHVCPGCTLAWTGTATFRVDAGYRARVCSHDAAARVEADDGRVGFGTPTDRLAMDRARVGDLERAFASVGSHRRLRVVQVGARQTTWLRTAAQGRRVNLVALEPWGPWANAARAAELDVQQHPLEGWRRRGSFDLIVEHDVLPHLADPMAHLQAIWARLAPGGVALVEVPNLLCAAGSSTDEFLTNGRPYWFTPRALVTACKRAGLEPFHLVAEGRLRVLCRRADPLAVTVPGPTAEAVVEAVRGNDLRLHLKRALFATGATPAALRMAATIHARCSRAAVRADLAIEIATACERGSDLDGAATWLERSQLDRPDPEVARTLAQLDHVRQRVHSVWREVAAANGSMPTEYARLAS